MTLLAIQADHAALLELLEETAGEITPENEAAIDTMIEELKSNIAEKADGYCNLLAHMKARAAMYQERKEVFQKSQKAMENSHDRLREKLKAFGITTGLLTCSEEIPGSKKKKPGNKIETTSGWVVSVQPAGGKRALIVDETFPDVPEEFLVYEAPKIDKDKVRKALEAGQTLPFAHLEPQGINLIIK